jgi:YegS/Rv2252/BmrU family lipid kinase
MVRTAVLIANPKTGRYSAKNRQELDPICNYLKASGINVELSLTTRPKHATEIAAEAARSGIREIIAAGGDGTINEVLQGIIGTKTRLGILPRGTANVLARELRLPENVATAADLIVRGTPRRIHVGRATNESSGEQRYFFLMAGIGLDASVVRRVHPHLKKRVGKAAFWYSGLTHLADWRPTPFQIEINGELLRATFAVIGNAASYGGNLSVTPRARLDQPEFEICVINSRSRLRYLQLLPYVLRRGVPEEKRLVKFIKSAEARAVGNALVQLDGELVGELPMQFEIAHQTVEVFAPEP